MHLQILTCPVHKQPHTHTAATLRGTSLSAFHPERMGHGIGSPDSRDAAHQATWKDRHRPSLEADPGIPLFSGSSRHVQSAEKSWTVLPTLNTPLRLHGTHKPSRRRKYLRWWHRGQKLLVPQKKLGLRHPRCLFLYLTLQTLFPSLLTHPPGSPHFSLCSLSCPSPRPREPPALSAVSNMLTYSPSVPGGNRYFPTPFFVLGTGALVRYLLRAHSSPVPFFR